MKIIFNKYGGLKTIEDRQLLVQSSDNANYVDIYYQDENGNFADETVNLATIAFKRADSFEIMEKTCDAVREELTNKLLYFRYVFQEDDLAVNGELQITVRLKQVVFDPEDETQILLIKQRAMGKLVAHIYEAIGTDYEYYNVIDGRLLQLELWQSTFDGTYYDVTQIDAIIAQEALNRNNAINDHNNNANAHANIREKIATNTANIATIDERLGGLELFAETLETNITEEIEGAVSTHNTSELAHPFLQGKIDEARAIAEGKVSAMSFETKEDLDAWLEIPENRETLLVGTNFYIEDLTSPDYWWNGTTLVELSTDKIDLTEYAKKTDIPDITVNNGDAESGKYISQVAVDATDKHKLVITKADLPQGFSGNYEDLTNKPTIPTVPTISTNITTDATSDAKTASPKAVKTYVDNAISAALDNLLGGEY